MSYFKVFLGGTIGNTDWRSIFQRFLTKYNISYFNPQIKNRQWNQEDRQNEENEKLSSNIHLYVITPQMTGLYSIAELVQSSNIENINTVVVFLKKIGNKQFNDNVFNSLKNIKDLIKENNNTYVYFNLRDALVKISQITRGIKE